jgi:hypothetical protein
LEGLKDSVEQDESVVYYEAAIFRQTKTSAIPVIVPAAINDELFPRQWNLLSDNSSQLQQNVILGSVRQTTVSSSPVTFSSLFIGYQRSPGVAAWIQWVRRSHSIRTLLLSPHVFHPYLRPRHHLDRRWFGFESL